MPGQQSKFILPQIKKVELRYFSLFTANPNVEFECNEGVTCLIGANGVGKSTLLSAINFCLTGIVSEASRDFKSMEEYYDYSLRYSSSYFRGRINESDREEAEISLTFLLGDLQYKMSRGLFEPEELRSLTITNIRDNLLVHSCDDKTRRERHEFYKIKITNQIGLSSFPEFVFLQHFVFTFDERRLTLFWNQKILERVLYLSFGLDPDMAKKVDATKRELDSADSQVRNRQWDITKTTKHINGLRSKYETMNSAQQNYDFLSAEYEKLTQSLNDEVNNLDSIMKQLKDVNLRIAALTAQESGLRYEYSQAFDSGFQRKLPLAQHPFFTQSIVNQTCGLCGATGKNVTIELESKKDSAICPLCNSRISTEPLTQEIVISLKSIDTEIFKVKKNIQESLSEIERLKKEELDAQIKVQALRNQVKEFENENEANMLLMKNTLTNDGNVEILLSSYLKQLEKVSDEKKDAEQRRARCKETLINLQRDLQQQYIKVEQEFVPAFRELAHLFLGMDLNVNMETDASGLNLVIDVRGTTRRLPHHLSESQRFFLDIALRMAIIKFVSKSNAKGTLFLDTPEGSLDIAYEKRAGDMLGRFVGAGHHVIMSANLNSSNLLLALAHSCKNERMQICRMTDWAELSDVQREEEDLFDQAYKTLEKALKD